MIIKTKRLVLKPLGIEYLESAHEYASDIENTKYMVHLPNKTLEETKEFLLYVEKQWEGDSQDSYEFAIIFEGKHIGAVSVYVDENLVGELGWIVNKKYWNRGIASEAAMAVMDFFVNELNVKHFIATCDSENVASYRIMEKLGMSRSLVSLGRKNKASDEERTEYKYELYL